MDAAKQGLADEMRELLVEGADKEFIDRVRDMNVLCLFALRARLLVCLYVTRIPAFWSGNLFYFNSFPTDLD